MSFPAALPSCTVILCTRQRPELLALCLSSLRQLHYPDFTILVIENDAAASECEGIAARFGAEYRLCTRRGLSAARNLGVRLSSTELVAFIDDDATCDPNWLVRSASRFRDPRVQAVTGRIEFLSSGESAHEFDPDDRTVDQTTPDWFGMANFGGLGLGSNFLVRRSVLDKVGGFDERLGRGAALGCSEENDLLFRIIDAGYAVATCSQSVVQHPAPKREADREVFRSVAASTVMVAMLAIEHPSHLTRLVRYLIGAIFRRPQPWRERPARLFGNMAAKRTIYSALLAGPFIYLGATLRYLIDGTPEYQTPNGCGILSAVDPREEADRPLRTHVS